MPLDNNTAHQIAHLAIALDQAERVLVEHERTGAFQAARSARQIADQLRIQLADTIDQAHAHQAHKQPVEHRVVIRARTVHK